MMIFLHVWMTWDADFFIFPFTQSHFISYEKINLFFRRNYLSMYVCFYGNNFCLNLYFDLDCCTYKSIIYLSSHSFSALYMFTLKCLYTYQTNFDFALSFLHIHILKLKLEYQKKRLKRFMIKIFSYLWTKKANSYLISRNR